MALPCGTTGSLSPTFVLARPVCLAIKLWDLLQPQDVMSRHRGAKPPRRCGLLGEISLLSPG